MSRWKSLRDAVVKVQRVLIVGAGGHAQVVADILQVAAQAGAALEPIGFVDDDASLQAQKLVGLPVLGTLAAVAQVPHDALIIAIGDNAMRRRLYESFRARGEQFASACHPHAVISAHARVGEGTMVAAGVVVNAGSVIGANVILNTGCSVDHHNQIGAHAHIAPGARLGGGVVVAEGAFLGVGVCVIPGRRIGEWARIGAGAVVISDIPARVTALGVPARVKRENSSV